MKEINLNYDYLKFEPIREPWNTYETEDGAIIKVKVLLVKLMPDPESKNSYVLNTSNVVGIEAKPELRGQPTLKPGQIPEIQEKEVKYRTVSEEWNEYRLENGETLKLKLVIAEISKGKGYDSYGEPIYNIMSAIIAKNG